MPHIRSHSATKNATPRCVIMEKVDECKRYIPTSGASGGQAVLGNVSPPEL